MAENTITYCSMAECSEKAHARTWCKKHYARYCRHGSPNTKYCLGTGQTVVEKFWSRVAVTANDDKCWEWQASLNENGYGTVRIGHTKWLAHRYAWTLANERSSTLFILHRCDNPLCCNPKHLFEGTHQDNMDDMVAKGRHCQGIKNSMSKYTEAQIGQRVRNAMMWTARIELTADTSDEVLDQIHELAIELDSFGQLR